MQVKLFKALASETRLKIVKELLKGEVCCEKLSKCLEKDLSTISRHLKILEDAKIIKIERKGKYKCISLRNKDLILKLLKIAEEVVKNESV